METLGLKMLTIYASPSKCIYTKEKRPRSPCCGSNSYHFSQIPPRKYENQVYLYSAAINNNNKK
ncbi:unnamed protein product [Cunninghamella blakesleeana]